MCIINFTFDASEGTSDAHDDRKLSPGSICVFYDDACMSQRDWRAALSETVLLRSRE